MGPDRQRDLLIDDPRRIREARKVFAVFFAVVLEPRNWVRIVNAGADAGSVETPNDLRPLVRQRAVKHRREAIMAAGLAGGSDIQNHNVLKARQSLLQR